VRNGNGNGNRLVRFGPFEADFHSREVRKAGSRIRIQDQPFKVLQILLESAGDLVTREELQSHIWPNESFGDFDHAVNVAVGKLRAALGDSADNPSFIETVPRRGYRFVAPLEGAAAETLLDLPPKAGIPNVTPASDLKRRPAALLALLAALVLLAAGIFVLWRTRFRQREPDPVSRLQETKISRISADGNIGPVAISPDGKYIAFASSDNGKEPERSAQGAAAITWQLRGPLRPGVSLRIRQLSGASSVEIASSKNAYNDLTFGPDGNSIFYRQQDDNGMGFVYQVPVLGGGSRKVATDVDSSVTVSPDGKKLAFVRHNPPKEISQLVIAMTDGTGEQVLAQTKYPEAFDYPAWSRDGARVACVLRKSLLGALADLVEVDVANGKRGRPILQDWPGLGQLAWTANPDGLVFVGQDGTASGQGQLFYLPYPNGTPRKITNGVDVYERLSVSNDSRHLATVLVQSNATIWVAPASEPERLKQVTAGPGRSDGAVGLAWTKDGSLIFSSRASGSGALWTANLKNGTTQQLTTSADEDFFPSGMPDGSILFSSTRLSGKMRIWRMNGDGSDARQLTSGSDDNRAVSTPDGRWVFYQSSAGGQSSIWRIPIGGGKAERMSQDLSGAPGISPNGKKFAYFEVLRDGYKLVAAPIDSNSPRWIFQLPFVTTPTDDPVWGSDSSTLQYLRNRDNVTNLWSQPIFGGPAKQLTHYSSGQIFAFAWSRDFSQLALSRGEITRNVVLIEDLK
jgi:Tol biopolymer transport system component/DNA-binding winged helix-turn-helix (wHTH) protein